MLKKEILLPGVHNSRELGGYLAGGRIVKKGVLIRTGELVNAAPEAKIKLSETYHIKHIVDFRMKSEVVKSPDPIIPGADNHNYSVVEIEDYFAMLGNTDIPKDILSQPMDKSRMIEIAYERGLIGPQMYSMYLLGDRGKKAYKDFFRLIIESDPDKGAVLWHCTDGKDRAGLAAALLLAALGADMKTILDDYMLTNVYNEQKIDAIKSKYSDCTQEKQDAMIFAGGGVIDSYLMNTFSSINKVFGSVEGYLTDGLGLNNSDLILLREKLTFFTQ